METTDANVFNGLAALLVLVRSASDAIPQAEAREVALLDDACLSTLNSGESVGDASNAEGGGNENLGVHFD